MHIFTDEIPGEFFEGSKIDKFFQETTALSVRMVPYLSWHTDLADEIIMLRPRHTDLVDEIIILRPQHTDLVNRIFMPRQKMDYCPNQTSFSHL